MKRYDVTLCTYVVVLKGIIGYSDYSLAVMIFECFKSNGIFISFLKTHT